MKNYFFTFIFFGVFLSCQPKKKNIEYRSETLEIKKISDNVYIHISQLKIPNYGKFGCNGLIYIHDNEAIIFDTPTDTLSSQEMINWIQGEKKVNIKSVVPTHFHVDCVAGLKNFHKANIPSVASVKTSLWAQRLGFESAKKTFNDSIDLFLGSKKIEVRFLGEGHTKDNVVVYLPEDEVLFGGCLVKSLKAGKGNLEDANIDEWSNTIVRIKEVYPNLKTVIPGHGKSGGRNLLDHTAKMFHK